MNQEINFPRTNFSEKGYFIAKASSIQPLINLQTFLVESIDSYYSHPDKLTNEDLLNNFHNYYSSEESKLNDVRMKVMNEINGSKKVKSLSSNIFESFPDLITHLIGPDILAQKGTNLVIQPPESSFFSELHSDAPGNSEFELVVWIPMVNCYEGKSFYIIDKVNSLKLLTSYRKGKFTGWDNFRESAIPLAREVDIPFGYALFFWSGLLHGSFVNTSNETRWSFNTRFKNSFSPCGIKDPFQYFSPIKISDLTKLALDSLET